MNQLSKYPWLNWYVSNLKSIPGATYRFGFTKDQTRAASRITMSPFRMGATPVTWGMWKEYCKAETVRMPYKPEWGYSDDHPVVNVSWEDIMKSGGFCEWASGVAGFKLTLPTDAQWEYAARGGKDGLQYPWGNDFDDSKLWCSRELGVISRTARIVDGNVRIYRSGYGLVDTTAPVDRTNRIYRNGYGLTDMVGNVWQWCADYYNDDYRPNGKDPVDTRESKYYQRCIRGGSWYTLTPDNFRCATRIGSLPDIRYNLNDIGFRLSAGQK